MSAKQMEFSIKNGVHCTECMEKKFEKANLGEAVNEYLKRYYRNNLVKVFYRLEL